jgi:hypothetical protein
MGFCSPSAAGVCGSLPGRSLPARSGRLCASLQVIALGQEVGRPVSQIALLALKPKGTGSRSRNSTPLSRTASMCARAVEDLALELQGVAARVHGRARVAEAFFRRRLGEARGRARLRHAARGASTQGDPRARPGAAGRQGAPLDQRKACRLPQWATLRPILAPSVSANRKWMPDQMRASTMSSRSCEKLVNCRVTPPGVVPLNVARSRW